MQFVGRTTLSKFVIENTRGQHSEMGALLIDVAAAVKTISALVGKGVLSGYVGGANVINVQGEEQKQIDVISNEAILRHCEWGGQLAGMASEELDEPYPIPEQFPRGRYLLVFDPLDGSSNSDVNVSVGTIFSILERDAPGNAATSDFLQPGRRQLAAGYAIYGPSTMLVLTLGKGTHGFTLDREGGNFLLTHPDIKVPESTREFAINASNERFWEPPVQRYVSECRAGKSDVRGADFNMRWIASMVAEVHRILMRGGIFMYPKDSKDPGKPGRLRLLYEASPMAMLIEQAGGMASTGRQRILDIAPDALHQRVPVLLGSKEEVERLERYHHEYDTGTDRPFESPLFKERSLFRS
ncbi:MAG: class 1 fructose-bisphosphatase [Azonexus sp.]|jgi:fructose-1,6-bisphosphatase I/sedoheptulose-1,7-bisphosphatase/fructose-1,6-bisphosphatase I|nr:class 1 fructose-bisphosphatase [Azonexus sp.]